VIATYSQICSNVDFLKITPVEKVHRMVPAEFTFMGLPDVSDRIQFHQREQFWIKHLKTLKPHGLNIREELPPSIPFCIRHNDQAYIIAKLVRTTFDRIQERTGYVFRRSQIVTAYKRNQNLSDILIRSKLD